MPQQDLINQVVNRVNDFNRRVRDLEEKIRNLTARVNTLDDTILNKTKTLSSSIQDMEDEMEELRDRLANMEVDIKEINRQKRQFVTEQELDEMENYMDLMNPINSSFMTKKEVKSLLDDRKGVSRQEVEKIIDRKIKNMENKAEDRDSASLDRKEDKK